MLDNTNLSLIHISTLNYSVDKDRTIESKKFIEIVEARVEEIVENAWFQVPAEFSDKLMGGIIPVSYTHLVLSLSTE